ncbi:MAG: geranylgeranylglycerol-phosphate geranylgeranyltransferase [Fidelibacterota bacterium]
MKRSSVIPLEKVEPYFLVLRPQNMGISFLSIFLGAFITGSISPLQKIILACISGSLIAGAANAINDYYDYSIDAINKPWRPIPSGKIKRERVLYLSIFLFAIGIFLSFWINLTSITISITASALLYLYSSRLKGVALAGNLIVSSVAGLAFVYGSAAANRPLIGLIPGGFALLFHLGREIIKDIQDWEADRKEKALTLPVRYGIRYSLRFITIIFSILIAGTLLPFIFKIYNLNYLVTVVLGVDTVLLYTMISMWLKPNSENLGKLSGILKIDMLVGLLAIYMG